MAFKLQFPKFLRSTKSLHTKNGLANYYLLYAETLRMLSEKMDEDVNEALKNKVKEYLARYNNNYDEAKNQLFAEFEIQIEIMKQRKILFLQQQPDKNEN